MDIFNKVNSRQLYLLWRNFTMAIISIVVVLASMKIMPVVFAPFIALLCAALLYVYIVRNKKDNQTICMIIPYTIMYVMVVFSFVLILLNVLFSFDVISLDKEFLYYNRPFIPILYLGPIATSVLFVIFFRRNKLLICTNCKMKNGDKFERGEIGNIYDYESHLQLKNGLSIFILITIVTWGYYIFLYDDTNINHRDSYVFTWLTIIIFLIDEIFFAMRYYHIYVELKEENRIITPDEIADISVQTYLRYYVICDNYIYVNKFVENNSEIIDTPFFSKKIVNGISQIEIENIIKNLTGVDNGELRFFFGRISDDSAKLHLLRYFYFIDGTIENISKIKTDGYWINYNEIQRIYMRTPDKLSTIMLSDTTRLATIIMTEKIFDDKGNRKFIIKSYRPTFNLIDVRESKLDFQEDKWLHISKLNSDSSFFKIKRFVNKILKISNI